MGGPDGGYGGVRRERSGPEQEAGRALRIGLFGALRVRRGDGTIVSPTEWKTAKARGLLRILALHVDQPVAVDRLVEWLWPQVPVDKGRASLRTAASHVRHVLATERLHRIGEALLLEDADVDAVTFRSSSQLALRWFARGELLPALEQARYALGLYRMDLAEDEPYLDPVLDARDHLRLLRTELLVAGGAASLDLDVPSEALALLTQAMETDVTCERACRLLMRTYVRLGEPAMAARVFERCRRALADELGVDPSRETRELHVAVLRGSLDQRPPSPVTLLPSARSG